MAELTLQRFQPEVAAVADPVRRLVLQPAGAVGLDRQRVEDPEACERVAALVRRPVRRPGGHLGEAPVDRLRGNRSAMRVGMITEKKGVGGLLFLAKVAV